MSGLKKINEGENQGYLETASIYAEILLKEDINEGAIDEAIEELRPLRMWYHAQKFGEAPGYRRYGSTHNDFP
jgi:hypothetical protein